MEKAKNSLLWIEVGYTLFAEEGLEGLQVERIARLLSLNKSGFYHYFGDIEGFCMELANMHERKVDLFLMEVRAAKELDPDYVLLLVKYARMVMFQVQLTRNKEHLSFYEISQFVDRRVNLAIRELWVNYLGARGNSETAMEYFHIVRDRFYTRASFQNLNYAFIHSLVTEARALLHQIARRRTSANLQAKS